MIEIWMNQSEVKVYKNKKTKQKVVLFTLYFIVIVIIIFTNVSGADSKTF